MCACGNNKVSPLVSILILSYRNLDGIFTTLDSILAQDYPNIEIVISDDGTPGFEECAPLLVAHVEKHSEPRRSLVLNPIKVNAGTVKNVNSAIRLAHGRYIKTISPDDAFSVDCAISDYVKFMEENDYLVCFAKMRGVGEDGTVYRNLAACETNYDLLATLSPKEILDRLYARNFLPGAAEFFDQRVFSEYGLFDERICLIEDYSYWLHLAQNNVQFGFLDKTLIDYSLSGVSSSGSYSTLFMEDMANIYERYIFPFDNRYGVFQPVYNSLKKRGLNYYYEKAQMDDKTHFQRALFVIRYLPYCVYTRFANGNKL